MKLRKIILHSPKYRGLNQFELKFPKHKLIETQEPQINPLILVGKNGCGKSNFLELLADIFYFIESSLLNEEYTDLNPAYTVYADNEKKLPLFFEIEYELKSENNELEIVKIVYSQSEKKKSTELKFYVNDIERTENKRKVLPKIVAYTSGANELLSMPFIDLQDCFAKEVTDKKKSENETKISVNPENSEPIDSVTLQNISQIVQPKLMLMDYDSNAAIVVSNFLLNEPQKLQIIKRTIRIKDLDSFRITIRLNTMRGKKQPIIIPHEFKAYIESLVKCSTCNRIEGDETIGKIYTLDFLVDDICKQAFRTEFQNGENLFNVLFKLNLLNTFSITKDYHSELKKKRKQGIFLKFPTIATLDKIFNIERIELVLDQPKVKTEYLKLSDGEHQFISIVGGMLLFDNPESEVIYLLDEPETHFNPMWRSDLFSNLQQALEKKSQQIVLTTHSPFILSDCHGYNVYHFQRNEGVVSFNMVEYETYGATFSSLLQRIFDFKQQISTKSYSELMVLGGELERIDPNQPLTNSLKDSIQKMESTIMLFGESIEKLHILNILDRIKTNFIIND